MSLKDPNVASKSHPKRVAIVVANPAVSTTTQCPVGFWWSELTHPYYVLSEAGYAIEIFSPDGGKCEADAMSDPRDPSGYSSNDLISMGFIASPNLSALVENTKPVLEIDVQKFDAIIVAGGQAPMFTFDAATDLQKKFVEFYEAGKVAAALCHGTAILRYARLSNGDLLVKGKTVTGFANVEEDFSDSFVGQKVMPWRVEDVLRERGANYVEGGLFKAFAVRDGRLITGQQQYSGRRVAQMVIEALGV